MAMKVLLIYPPWLDVYGRFKTAARLGCASVPLGLCYLASAIQDQGHQVKIIDAETEGADIQHIVEQGLEWQPDLIGITATTPIFHTAKELAKSFKEKADIPIVIGGVHTTIVQEEALKECNYFDYGVYGEGEQTFPQLIDRIAARRPLQDVLGIIYRQDGEILKTLPRPHCENLDAILFPERRLLRLNNYIHSLPGKGLVKYTGIFTSRGCPFHCTFCSQHTMFGRRVRFRSVENVLSELQEIVNELGIKHVIIMDENLTLDNQRVKQFCERILKADLRFSWEGWTHVSTVNEETLQLMKQAGLIKISFGIESGDPYILEKIKKNVTLEKVKEAYRIAKRLKLETRGSVIIGHPFETRQTALRTINFVSSLQGCDQIFLNIATPYPGTELYDHAVHGIGGIKLLTKDFSQYSRYGDPVIEVNDLSKKDLIKLQRIGLLRFYLRPRRVWYNFKRAGLKAGWRNVSAFARSIMQR